MTDPIYYKIQRTKTGKYNVCCLQWFDEDDYDKSLWVRDEYGQVLTFETDASAEMYVQAYLENPTVSKHTLLKKLSSVAGTLDNILDGTTPQIKHRQSVVKAHFELGNIIDQLQEELKNNG